MFEKCTTPPLLFFQFHVVLLTSSFLKFKSSAIMLYFCSHLSPYRGSAVVESYGYIESIVEISKEMASLVLDFTDAYNLDIFVSRVKE